MYQYIACPHSATPYPVVHLTVPDRIVDAIARPCRCRQCLVANVEVQVLGTTLPREMTARPTAAGEEGGLVRDGGAS
jgi:hypothetical protein